MVLSAGFEPSILALKGLPPSRLVDESIWYPMSDAQLLIIPFWRNLQAPVNAFPDLWDNWRLFDSMPKLRKAFWQYAQTAEGFLTVCPNCGRFDKNLQLNRTSSCYHSICPYVLVSGVMDNLPALSSSTGEVSGWPITRHLYAFGICKFLTISCS